MTAEDADALLLVFTDPKVMASFGGTLFDRDQMWGWVERNLAHQVVYGYGLFVVINKTTGALIGDCGLSRMEIEGREEVELGYDLRSDHWNRGLGTEAAKAVLNYARTKLGLERLVSLVRTTNRASQRVAEKVGMTRERSLRRGEADYWLYATVKTPPHPNG